MKIGGPTPAWPPAVIATLRSLLNSRCMAIHLRSAISTSRYDGGASSIPLTG